MKREIVDRIMAISAILISLLTLIIFIYQTNLMHKESRLSVTPRIGFHTVFSEGDSTITYSFSIQNKGIGPAIIDSAKVIFEGKKYEVDMEYFFATVYPGLVNYGNFNSFASIGEGSTLTANERQVLFSYTFDEENMQEIQKYLNVDEDDDLPFNLILQYRSIYEDRWIIDSDDNGHPKKLR